MGALPPNPGDGCDKIKVYQKFRKTLSAAACLAPTEEPFFCHLDALFKLIVCIRSISAVDVADEAAGAFNLLILLHGNLDSHFK